MGEWRNLTLREAGVQLLDCVHKTPTQVASGQPYPAIPQFLNSSISSIEKRGGQFQKGWVLFGG